jgi:hypothetical protein
MSALSRVDPDRRVEPPLRAGGELRRNLDIARWYCGGSGGFTDRQVKHLVRQGVLAFTDEHRDRLILAAAVKP